MAERTESQLIHPDEIIMNKIFLIRNPKVMLDKDLAELYGIETKVREMLTDTLSLKLDIEEIKRKLSILKKS